MVLTIFSNFKKFKNFLGNEVWFLFTISIFVGLFWFLIESSFIFVLQGFLSSLKLTPVEQTFLPDFYPKSPIGAMLCLLGFGLLRSTAIAMKYYFSEITNQAFVRTQRERILEYSLNETAQVSMHETLNIFNEKISSSAGVIQLITILINTIVSCCLFFILGMRLAPIELGLGIFLLAAFFLPLKFINKSITEFGNRHGVESNMIAHILILGLKNHFLLKIYNLTAGEVERGKTAAKRYEHLFKKYILFSAIKVSFPQIAGAFIITIMCYISFEYIKTPSMKLLSFIYIFMRLAQGMSEASATLSSIRFNLSKFKDLYRWNVLCRNYTEAKSKRIVPELNLGPEFANQGINFLVKDLHFRHKDSSELFFGLNLEIKRGEILLIKGRSGCGKSTLLTLLLGLENPVRGQILINGERADQVRSSIAPFISYVGPEPFINGGTIRENLLYGNQHAEHSDDDLHEVLKSAQLIDVVTACKGGLDRELKEVTELSTGQKQRLSIARALLRHPKVLILDEATANLDSSTEKEIVNVIKRISSYMTVIIISHKDSFDSITDKILNLEEIKNINHSSLNTVNF